ncbi:MAG: InlB B-repeat-containing protein [Oscillospiraceae bacterium]|nr:InlB B-repeat-containing protein [Oscillospiraceae bacterium]
MKCDIRKLTALCLILTIIVSIFGSQVALASTTTTGTGNVGVTFTTGPRTVTFMLNYGSDGVHAAVVVDGGSNIRETTNAQMPATPDRTDGFSFVGWNTHPDGTGEWFNDRTVVRDNTTVYARWTQHWYTVQFIDRDGTPISTMRVPHGGSAIAPPNPSMTGWIFIGWDRPFTNVTDDITVRAVYREVVVTPTPPPVITTPPPVVTTPPPVATPPPPVVIVQPPAQPPPPPPPNPPVVIVQPPPPAVAPVMIMQPAAPRPPAPQPAPPPPALPPAEPPPVEIVLPEEPPVIETIIPDQPVPAAPPAQPITDQILEHPVIPLANPRFIFFAPWSSDHWAMLNLILTAIGAVLVPIAFIKILQKRKQIERAAKAKLKSLGQNETYIIDEENLYQHRRLEWFAATAVLGGMGILIFALTQDASKIMALMDWWTIFHTIVFILEVITFNLIYKKDKNEPAKTIKV